MSPVSTHWDPNEKLEKKGFLTINRDPVDKKKYELVEDEKSLKKWCDFVLQPHQHQ